MKKANNKPMSHCDGCDHDVEKVKRVNVDNGATWIAGYWCEDCFRKAQVDKIHFQELENANA